MKKCYILSIIFVLILVVWGMTDFLIKKDFEKKLLEENERNEELLKDDYYSQRIKKFAENKKSEQEFEENINKTSEEYQMENPMKTNFYSDKKEVIVIENIKAQNNFIDSLISNIVMFLKYYDITVTKEELKSSLTFDTLRQIDGKVFGNSPKDSCIIGVDNQFIGCIKPYVDQVLQNIISEKKPNEYIDNRDSGFGMNIHYSIPDIPIIIWVGENLLEAKETYEWYSYDGTQKYTLPKNMHTVLYLGYDKENFYINDPLKDGTLKVKRDILEKTYDSYGRQRVVMYRGRSGLYK